MEWLLLLIPILLTGIVKKLFPRELVWWEVCLPFCVCIVAILVGKYAADTFATKDTEYLGGYLVEAAYYEPWDEEVPCRHPRYCTRTVSYTDGNGSSQTRSETYQCGTEHLYDVDYHPEYWDKVDSNGVHWDISKNEFETFCQEWANKKFVDLHRSYHSIDGDKYQSNWDTKYEHLHPTVVTHSYENRVAASNSTLNYREVPDAEKQQHKLFNYPASSYFVPSVLGYSHPGNVDLDKTNALLGRQQQIRIWLLCFQNQPLQAAFSQEAYWKKGNKNELVICVSLDASAKIQWSHVFSWTEREDFKITVRQWLEDRAGQILDAKAFNDFIKPEIQKSWQRKHFKEFAYIDVPLSGWAYFWISFLACLATVGSLCFGAKNDIRE